MTEEQERMLRLNRDKFQDIEDVVLFAREHGQFFPEWLFNTEWFDLELAPPKDFLKDCPLEFAGCKLKMKESKHV